MRYQNRRRVTYSQLVHLRTLAAVIEKGGFSTAAEYLRLTPSAVSKHIAQLESGLCVRLLDRTTRHVQPTDAGMIIYEKTRQSLSELEDSLDSIAYRNREAEGTIRISATPALGNLWLLPILKKLALQYPKLKFQIEFTDRRTELIENKVDLAIREGPLPDSSLRARRIGESQIILCAALSTASRGASINCRIVDP
jgi:DNA-binding transcriptional LysR family regulator